MMMLSSFVPNLLRSRGKHVLLVAMLLLLVAGASAVYRPSKSGKKGGYRRRAASYDVLYRSTNGDDYSPYVTFRSSGSSYGKKGSYGGKGGSPAVNKLQQCQNTCDSGLTPSAAPSASPTKQYSYSNTKPACCKGGVSSLKMVYSGPSGDLHLPASDGLSGLTIDDPCNGSSHGGGGSNSNGVIKFVDCDVCFPGGDSYSPESCDSSGTDSKEVSTGTPVCLASFDDEDGDYALNIKFKTNMDLYFVEQGGSSSALKTIIHTSCSVEVYPPFAAQMEVCEKDQDFIVDLSIAGSTLTGPSLEFIDGTSANSPSELFTQCDGGSHDKDDHCCKGGVSYLKVRVGGTSGPGVLTADDTDASSSPCGYESTIGSSRDIRFVPCPDDCDGNCDQEWTSIPVDPSEGTEVCIRSYNVYTNELSYTAKMPTNLNLFFLPDSGETIQAAAVHTSCSKPVYPPYAQIFTDDCDPKDAPRVKVDQIESGSHEFYLEFIDGKSIDYYEARESLGTPSFDITFAECDCTCDTASPTASPAPTVARNPGSPGFPTAPTPQEVQSTPPPTPELQTPSPPINCLHRCKEFAKTHCVFAGSNLGSDGEQCVVGGARRRLSALEGQEVEGLSIKDQYKFHVSQAEMYRTMLEKFE